jgi:hypothetical protein
MYLNSFMKDELFESPPPAAGIGAFATTIS